VIIITDYYYLPLLLSVPLALRTLCISVCIIISNHIILAVTAVNECQEFDNIN